ncbi:hypothetical protein E3N88_28174 [Mikania micrantha]|uniref:Pentatricopeptide repeat-containing protein n=1 Tax=Mikania micrantha TaxID=192012 RepID=A0A5N6MYS1_9ASTR|nr:hypothetical protein E3N88_28174 [Mikania micrantha]
MPMRDSSMFSTISFNTHSTITTIGSHSSSSTAHASAHHPHTRLIFDSAYQPNVYTFTTMLKFYSHIGAHQDCITLFDIMRASNVMPDAFVFPILIKSMGEAAVVLHGHVLKLGHDSDRYVRNAIIYMYAKCGPIEFARRVFDEMPERMVADWNSMISGYWRWGNDVEAGSLF